MSPWIIVADSAEPRRGRLNKNAVARTTSIAPGFELRHFHDNWGNDQFRKVVLNALLWVAKAEVPVGGVQSQVTQVDLDANLDPKPGRK